MPASGGHRADAPTIHRVTPGKGNTTPVRKALLALADNTAVYKVIVGNPVFRRMAFRFVAGETLAEAIEAVRNLPEGTRASLDHLGENVSTADEAWGACNEYLTALDEIAKTGIDSNVSLKLTQMGIDLGGDLCLEVMRKILERARQRGNFVRIDMEGSNYTDATLEVLRTLRKDYDNVGVVIQAYLFRSEADVIELNKLGIPVRLCKGAYAEPPSVAFAAKSDTDENYRKLTTLLLAEGTRPAIATHDPVIIAWVKEFAEKGGIPRDRFEFQMLYGIRRNLQKQLREEGYNLRVYVPFGKQWYPYFMRRLAERPANLMFFLSSLVKT